MRKHFLAAFSSTLVLLAVSTPVAAQGKPSFPLVEASTGRAGWTIQKCPDELASEPGRDDRCVVASIPCERDPSWADGFTLEAFLIQYESNASARALASGSATCRLAGSGAGVPEWLVFTLRDLDGADAGGTLWIDVASVLPAKDPVPAKRGVHRFEFIRAKPPARKLVATPPTVRLEIVRPLCGRPRVAMSPLELSVANAPSDARTTVSFRIDPAAAAAAPSMGRLAVTSIAATGDGIVPVESVQARDFPLGSVERQMIAVADGLVTPSIKFTIASRRTYWLLVACLALGILAGWLVRNFLPLAMEKERHRAQLARLDERIAAEGAWRRSDSFARATEDLARQVARLRDEPWQPDSAVRNARLRAIEEGLERATAAFDQESTTLLQELAAERDALAADWHVAATIRRALDVAVAAVAQAADAASGGDLERSRSTRRDALAPLPGTIATTGRDWSTAVSQALDRLEASTVTTPAAKQIGAAVETFRSAPFPGELQEPAPDAAIVDRDAYVRSALKALDRSWRAGEAAWSHVRKVALAAVASANDDAARGARDRLTAFDPEVALEADVPDFSAVAEDVVEALKNVSAVVLRDAGKAQALRVPVSGVPAAPGEGSPRIVYRRAPREERLIAERAVRNYGVVQTVIVGMLLTLLGCLVFLPTWVGAMPEIVKVLFWGFTADLGANALVEKAAPLTK